jgi:nicotinate-nucleotide adenylyltransferase
MKNYNGPILVFGGYFNPPTIAHREVVDVCLGLPGFEEVWVMPSGDRQDKRSEVSDNDRLAMLNIMRSEGFNNDPRLVISSFELDLPRPSSTYKTVGELAARFSGIDFWFAYGADAYRSMVNWQHGKVLQGSLNMVVFERDEDNVPFRQGIIPVKAPIRNGISSTAIREHAAKGKSTLGFVSSGIARYIEKHGLYSYKQLTNIS